MKTWNERKRLYIHILESIQLFTYFM